MHQLSVLSANSVVARCLLAATSLSAVALLSGCDGEAYNLGEDDPVGEEPASSCDVALDAAGTLLVQTQADVDALSGCRELPGNLFIDLPDGAESLSLAPLANLEVVRGLLSIEGPITSLAGLEALEQVSGLSLEGLLVSDLTPLRGLRTMQRQPDFRRIGGAISIAGCDQLVDLAGLENLAVWESLSINGVANLETLSGLQAPSRADSIEITGAPRLSDLSVLASVEEVTGLLLADTAVESLDGFLLQVAEWLQIGANSRLTSLDGLSRLMTVGILGIGDNDALLRVELPALDDFESITIVDNAALEAVPQYTASRGTFVPPAVTPNRGSFVPPAAGVDPTYFRLPRSSFEVGGNPQLKSIVLPTTFSDIEQVAIYDNASLVVLDLGYLRRSDGLAIQDNAVLDTASAPALERVADLAIRNNPALSVAPFANVLTFTRDVSGNLDEPAP
jgi:hypothetical protein